MTEERGSDVLHELPDAVIAVDLDDRVVSWNAAAERLFGWREGEVLGQRAPMAPSEPAIGRRWFGGPGTGDDAEATATWAHRDGRDVDVAVRVAALHGQGGEVVGTVVLCRDAGPQLRTASRLARSQSELVLIRRLASLVQRALQDLDVAGVLRAIMQVAVDLLDGDSGALSLEQAPGKYAQVANVNLPADAATHETVPGRGLHGSVLLTGEPIAVSAYDQWSESLDEFRGRGVHAASAVPITSDGRTLGVLSVHSHIAGRTFTQEEVDVLALLAEYASVALGNATAYRRVSAERERFLALVEAMPAGVAVVEQGVVTAWNAAAASLTGRPASEVIGSAPPLDLEAAADGLELVVEDGGRTWIEALRSDLPDTRGSVYLLRDLTEQRDLERAKDLFFATTSHELKTPLTVVKGLASTLLQHWDRMPEERRVDALQTIERRAENLDRLIERILVGSRVQAGGFEVAPTPIELGRLTTEIVVGFAAASPDHVVRADVAADLPLVAGDRQVLDTILGHLLENAIKYSPSGGEVVVLAATDAGNRRAVVEVRDHGVGIQGDIERLLDPFVQADSRITRRFGGVGLGLYIVRQLVDALGGQLWASNADGGGARFSFSVPLWEPWSERDEERSAQE